MPKKRKKSEEKRKEEESKILLSDEAIKKITKPIPLVTLLEYAKENGFTPGSFRSKLQLIKNTFRNEFTEKQFLKLWLMNEEATIMKNRRYTILKIQNIDEKMANASLIEEELNKFFNEKFKSKMGSFKVFELEEGKQFYILLEYKDDAKIVEEWLHNYKIIEPVSRIRLILSVEDSHGTVRIFRSRKKKHTQWALDLLKKALGTKVELEEIKIPPYKLRGIIEQSGVPVKRLTISTPVEISGTKGIYKITLEGEDVIRGIDEILSRHQVDLRKVGGWSSFETSEISLTIEGSAKTKDEDAEKIIEEL